MPQTPAISIVTTVYDAKEYLPRTVQSILAQTFTDFELLLVEDGSPNGCGELCDELAKTDPRIRVFHKPNGGPASAANVGLDNARGGYIGFVDSDDLIEPDMYERLYNAIQATGARIAACVGDAIDEQDAPIVGRDVSLRAYGVRDAEDLLLETFQTGSFYGPLSWNKLFDIRTFRDKGVRYDETMFFGDDASVLHLVFEGERAACLPDVLYHYRTRRGPDDRRRHLSAAQAGRSAHVLGLAAVFCRPPRRGRTLPLGRGVVLESSLPVLVHGRDRRQPGRAARGV